MMDAETKVPTDGTLNAAVERTKREAVENVLTQASGDTVEAAARLGILRTSLYRIMKRYGMATPTKTQTKTGRSAQHRNFSPLGE